MQLSVRVQHCAMRLALSDMLDRYGRALDGASPGPAPPSVPPTSEPYIHLHLTISASNLARFPGHSSGSGLTFLFLLFGSAIAQAALSIFSGSCIPLYSVFFFLYGLYAWLQDLINMAESNRGIAAHRALHSDALSEARMLLLRASPAPEDAAARELRAHMEVIKGWVGASEGSMARFAGFAVDYGVVRTVVVTFATVAIGLWSVLRSGGVGLVADMVCPS